MTSVLLTSFPLFIFFLGYTETTSAGTCGAVKQGVLKILSHSITKTVKPRCNERLYNEVLGQKIFFAPVVVKYMEKTP